MSSQLDNQQVIKQAIKRCLDFVEQFAKSNLNINGNRVTNAGDAVNNQDYVTLKQVKKYIPEVGDNENFRTICWSNNGLDLTNDLPWYRFGLHLDSKPIELWVKFDGSPTSDFVMDLYYAPTEDQSANSVLSTPLTVHADNSFGVTYSFDTVSFAQGGIVRPVITQGGDASNCSIGLIVLRTP